jgi:hypothetical protein
MRVQHAPRLPTDPVYGRDDFAVIAGGEAIGRIYRLSSVAAERWWGISAERAAPGHQNGIADTLDGAKAAFREAWDATSARHER